MLVRVMTFVAAVAGIVALLWFAQRSLIYFPDSHVPPPAAVGLPHAEIVTFDTEDGLHLAAWFVPAREPARDRTVIVFNGNAGHRGYRAPLAARLAEEGFSTLLVDYRGYGDNPGLPSERGLQRDARAALAYARSRPDVDPSRVIYFGESLGAAVAIALAAEHPPAALVLRSPFTSMADIGQHHYPFLPVRWLLRDRYPSIDRIGRIACPILIIAGSVDRVVPPASSMELYEAAPEPRRLVVIEDADHNDEALAWGPQVIEEIVRLSADGLRRTPSSP